MKTITDCAKVLECEPPLVGCGNTSGVKDEVMQSVFKQANAVMERNFKKGD